MDFSALFVKDASFHHLNAGTRSRVPLSVIEFMEKERREGERNPTRSLYVSYDRLWEVQRGLAAFLQADPKDIFLRANVTAAFNDFLFALPRLEKGEAVATGWEYGGIVGAVKHWARLSGLEFRMAPLKLEPGWDAASLKAAVLGSLRPQTRLLLLSHVATGTGAILPIEEIAVEARRLGVITLVDGAHAAGALPLSLAGLEADFYGGNFHKWFLGPEGTGFGWVHSVWKDRLEWKFGGWASERPPAFYQGFGDGDPETCRRFLPGTVDRVPVLGLGETLRFWERHGRDTLRARQKQLRDLARKKAEELGWRYLSPEVPTCLGPMVCFERPSSWQGEATALTTRIYLEAKVQLALPQVQETPLVRLSPGVYSSEEEIEGAFERLARWRP